MTAAPASWRLPRWMRGVSVSSRAAPPPPDPRIASPLFPIYELVRSNRSRNQDAIRALSANAYLGGATSLCRVLGRYKMFVDTNDGGLSVHLLIDGYWEMWLTEAMVEVIKPGMLAVDVGANLGYFTILMAELVGDAGQVHAFEPNEPMTARLRKSASVNGLGRRILAHSVALGDVEGADHHLVVQDDDPKNAFIVPAAPGTPDAPDMLKTRRMDAFEELLQADVVKIDADTAERLIWRGMRGIFDQNRPMTIFLEFNAARYPDPRAFLDEIVGEGFRISIIDLNEGIVASSIDHVLRSVDGEDQMLILRR